MSKVALKKYLGTLEKSEVIDVVLDLYDARKEAKEYLEYFLTFPMLNAGHGYEYRVFNRLFRFIGLCEINESDDFKGKNWGKEVRKTELLDMMFAFEEPQPSN